MNHNALHPQNVERNQLFPALLALRSAHATFSALCCGRFSRSLPTIRAMHAGHKRHAHRGGQKVGKAALKQGEFSAKAVDFSRKVGDFFRWLRAHFGQGAERCSRRARLSANLDANGQTLRGGLHKKSRRAAQDSLSGLNNKPVHRNRRRRCGHRVTAPRS